MKVKFCQTTRKVHKKTARRLYTFFKKKKNSLILLPNTRSLPFDKDKPPHVPKTTIKFITHCSPFSKLVKSHFRKGNILHDEGLKSNKLQLLLALFKMRFLERKRKIIISFFKSCGITAKRNLKTHHSSKTNRALNKMTFYSS